MVTKEIKQFVLSQMKDSDWDVEKFNDSNIYRSKYIDIRLETTIRQKVKFILKIPNGYSINELRLSRKELGINYFQFRWFLRNVKKSCKLVDKRRRDAEISRNWNKFLEKNKELKRDNKINQIID